MARFFFDLINGEGLVHDDVGVELGSCRSIRDEASRILTGIAAEEMLGQEQGDVLIEVRDEHGDYVFKGRLTFENQWFSTESLNIQSDDQVVKH
jgi:hypothetical protein